MHLLLRIFKVGVDQIHSDVDESSDLEAPERPVFLGSEGKNKATLSFLSTKLNDMFGSYAPM